MLICIYIYTQQSFYCIHNKHNKQTVGHSKTDTAHHGSHFLDAHSLGQEQAGKSTKTVKGMGRNLWQAKFDKIWYKPSDGNPWQSSNSDSYPVKSCEILAETDAAASRGFRIGSHPQQGVHMRLQILKDWQCMIVTLSHLRRISYMKYLHTFTVYHDISWYILQVCWHQHFSGEKTWWKTGVPCCWDAPLRTRSASPRSWPLLTSCFWHPLMDCATKPI